MSESGNDPEDRQTGKAGQEENPSQAPDVPMQPPGQPQPGREDPFTGPAQGPFPQNNLFAERPNNSGRIFSAFMERARRRNHPKGGEARRENPFMAGERMVGGSQREYARTGGAGEACANEEPVRVPPMLPGPDPTSILGSGSPQQIMTLYPPPPPLNENSPLLFPDPMESSSVTDTSVGTDTGQNTTAGTTATTPGPAGSTPPTSDPDPNLSAGPSPQPAKRTKRPKKPATAAKERADRLVQAMKEKWQQKHPGQEAQDFRPEAPPVMSCDECVRNTSKCNLFQPCIRCHGLGVDCLYELKGQAKYAQAKGKRKAEAITGGDGAAQYLDAKRPRLEVLSGPCLYCRAQGLECDADHDLRIECTPCSLQRAKCDPTHACVVGECLEEYWQKRHPALRKRYLTIRSVLSWRCVACLGSDRIDRKANCDVDPLVKIGCTRCQLTGAPCVWQPDKRNDDPGSFMLLRTRPVKSNFHHADRAARGEEQVRPWWRRRCAGCAVAGKWCSWMTDNRKMQYKCDACVEQDVACLDAEDDYRAVEAVWVDPPVGGGPNKIARLNDAPQIRRTKTSNPGPCGPCRAARRKCFAFLGGDAYACVRCHAYGMPCTERKGGLALPFTEQEQMGWGSGDAVMMEFHACGPCEKNNRWCDRYRPCDCCVEHRDTCDVPLTMPDLQSGCILRSSLKSENIISGSDYYVALGYGPLGVTSDRNDIPDNRVFGPPVPMWGLYTGQGKAVEITKGRRSRDELKNQKLRPKKPDTPAWKTRAQIEAIGLQQTVPPPPLYPFQQAMPHDQPGWLPQPFTQGLNLPSLNADGSNNNNDASYNVRYPWDSLAQGLNQDQAAGPILGDDFPTFEGFTNDDAMELDAFFDLAEFNVQGSDEGDDLAVGSELRDMLRSRLSRFTSVYLAHHPEPRFKELDQEYRVPPQERVLLTLEGQDPETPLQNPFAPPPHNEDQQQRDARSRYLLSRWNRPGFNVLRDIPDAEDLFHLDGQPCKEPTQHPGVPCGKPCGTDSFCANRQHMVAQDDNQEGPGTGTGTGTGTLGTLNPAWVCTACDHQTKANVSLSGLAAITGDEMLSMRTYACASCSCFEPFADGVIPAALALPITGCNCVEKLVGRRLCAQHRYILAAALTIHAALVNEWKIVNFKPDTCLFCKHQRGGIDGPNAPGEGDPRVYFCNNCQTRVVDEGPGMTLFGGWERWFGQGAESLG